ncbi:hypothetical protein BJX63DRAFT_392558 [Aspergillus granulosus]|uniref:SIMPL domain-containing protein n=1 Tax=Aspergillus granulosus TaxID=176169 RepID=A0ABR4HFJ9_9EURO
MAPLTIKTTGHAKQTRYPERAVLRLIVKDTGPKPAAVSSNVQTTTARIQNILNGLATAPTPKSPSGEPTAPILKWSMGPTTTYTFPRSDGSLSKSSTSKHIATSVLFEAEFASFKALGSAATELSSIDFVYPLGIEWRLTDATKEAVAAETRAAACRDAVKKAQDYARGVGKEERCKVEAVEVLEAGAGNVKEGNGDDGFRVLDALMERGHRLSGSGDPGWSFQPAEIEFRVDFTAKFVVE